MIELWSKGHTPNINDLELEEAVKTFNLTERFSVNLKSVSKLEAETVYLIQNKIDREKTRQQRKMKQQMKSVR